MQAVRLAAAVLTGKARVIGGPDDSSTSGAEKADDDVGATMSGVVAEINEAVAHRQVLNAIQHAREQDMYQPGYLESEPYLRLTLRRVNFDSPGFPTGTR